MKRFVSLILLTILIAGCSKKPEPTNQITLWHWMTDRDPAFQQLAQQYKELTGTTVKIELFAPPDAYTQRIIASAQAKTLPDVFGILDKKEIFAKFVKYGFVADLTDEFAKEEGAWEKALFEKALNVNRFTADNIYGVKPGIYGVPIDVTNIQMLYNKKLLAKAGYKKPPETFEEFLTIIEALNRMGISGFVSGWGELWMADAFASNYAFNIMGEDKIMSTYQGITPYTDPDWIKVFGIFETISKAGGFIQGIVTKPNKEAEQDFALGRAAFAYNGSWCVNVYHDMNPDLEYGAILPPAVKGKSQMKIWGGAGSSFVVNNSSLNKDKVVAFLRWLTDKDQQVFLATETKNLPSNREALAFIPEILADFAKVMDSTTHPTLWKYNELPKVVEAFDKGIQAIIIGEMTPAQVASEVQEVKLREQAKADRRK